MRCESVMTVAMAMTGREQDTSSVTTDALPPLALTQNSLARVAENTPFIFKMLSFFLTKAIYKLLDIYDKLIDSKAASLVKQPLYSSFVRRTGEKVTIP